MEIEELKTNNLMLNKKVTDMEKKINDFKLSGVTNKINVNKYKSTIFALNKILKLKEPKVKETISRENEDDKETNTVTGSATEQVIEERSKKK